MKIRTFATEVWLPLPREEVFAFFGDAGNLDAITPPWLHFRILTALPLTMGVGTLIDYRLRWHYLPMRWRTRITAWEPPIRFEDEQVRGPYHQWIHAHTFEEKDGGTSMRDRIDYATPGWPCEPIVNRLLVAPDLRHVFAYRQRKILDLLVGPGTTATTPVRRPQG